jgi:signal transduction histidine kinase
MIPARETNGEVERLDALDRYQILDTPPEACFEDLVRLTTHACRVPIAFIGLMDRDRQWMKARLGMHAAELPRDGSFCTYAVQDGQLLVVPDTIQDRRFSGHPMVRDHPRIRFYAGMPLFTPDRIAIGTLAIMDVHPRELSAEERDSLGILARQAGVLLESRRRLPVSMAEAPSVEDLELRLRRCQSGLDAAKAELAAFSYSISHDLRGPLRGIDGWSQALLEDCADRLDDSGRTYLSRVRAETQRLGLLIDELLQLSRLTQAEIRHSPVDLSSLVDTIVRQLRASDPSRRVEVRIQPDLRAEGDEALLRTALACLVDNAWKFSAKRDPAVIEFGRTVSAEPAAYYVRDNGAGFDMTYVGKLFAPFQRLHKGAEFLGNGIGLAKAHRVIRRHGGRIWAEARVGQGATFYFTLG